jgi:hypothetical protein
MKSGEWHHGDDLANNYGAHRTSGRGVTRGIFCGNAVMVRSSLHHSGGL